MIDPQPDLKTQANNLRKQKQFDQALPLYTQLWQSEHSQADKWVGWGYAQCLRKVGRSADALEICRAVYRIDPAFDHNNNLYGWCIYDTALKHQKPPLQDLLKAADAITKLTKHEKFSPYELVVFQALDALRDQMNVSWQQVFEWVNKLDPTQLSTQENRFTTASGKVIISASPLEKYYAHKTKALEQLQMHGDCLQTSEEALQKIRNFHHDNDIWFTRRAALAKGALGRQAEAITDLQRLTTRKPDWFLYHEIAQLYYELGQTDDALVAAATAALKPGPLNFKGALFKLLSTLMEELNETALAQEHIKLVHLIRAKEGWKHDPELAAELNRLEVEIDKDDNARLVVETLKPVWEQAQYANQQRIAGVVKKILNHGRAGFIMDTAGNDHYFDMGDVQDNPDYIQQGVEVTFYVVDSFDKVKNKKSTKAVQIAVQD